MIIKTKYNPGKIVYTIKKLTPFEHKIIKHKIQNIDSIFFTPTTPNTPPKLYNTIEVIFYKTEKDELIKETDIHKNIKTAQNIINTINK